MLLCNLAGQADAEVTLAFGIVEWNGHGFGSQILINWFIHLTPLAESVAFLFVNMKEIYYNSLLQSGLCKW